MSDKKDDEKERATWSHDSELSFKNVRDQLELARDGVQDAIDAYKKRIRALASIRDSFGKK
jgi:butyrate kinase